MFKMTFKNKPTIKSVTTSPGLPYVTALLNHFYIYIFINIFYKKNSH